ncbi:hypothetical protein PVL30_003103 [Lodderomyces elongisporus]|uniref:uncharacterized protein n=1 Tax=Lodderomyces elongisporus TaxID=36914 RepID=UPI0029242040|nr:uncharacterized protein PVL30_003103 [Lodderomyces elongisporus]WLF79351.1 hypothetical protein PVL30_003103 [Lodderomyces elongisporus]
MKFTNTLLSIAAVLAVSEAAPLVKTVVVTANPTTSWVTQIVVPTTTVSSIITTIYGPPGDVSQPTSTGTLSTVYGPPPGASSSVTSSATDSSSSTATASSSSETPSVSSTTSSSSSSSSSSTSTSSSSSSSSSSEIITSATSSSSSTTTTTSSSSSSSSSSATGPTGSIASSDPTFVAEILEKHNELRALHGVGDLTWDAEIADYAASYAASSFSCDNVELIHSNGPYGENLAAGYLGGDEPVQAWYDEIKDYDFNNPGYSTATGHFTQVVWKGTTKLGCARVMCNNAWRQYTICEYTDTRGNIVGADDATRNIYFVENVLPPISS